MPQRLLVRLLPSWNISKSLLPTTTSLATPSSIFFNTTSQPRPICLFTHRQFSVSLSHNKKGGKQQKELARAAAASPDSSSSTSLDDPTDFSTLNASIEKTLQHLKNDLGKLRTGGRFNPELLENVRVAITKDAKKTIRLAELAQVVPKGGRSIMLLVGEKDHIKPITSAIQSSKTLQLQPVPDAENPSQLNIAVPPPTKESRDQAIGAAGKAGEVAATGVRNARAAMQKTLRAMQLGGSVRPDELRKAGKEMEKIVEAASAEVKKIVEAAKKGMEQN